MTSTNRTEIVPLKASLRGFFDALVLRHVCLLNPAVSVKGVKDQVIEGKTPEITIDQARTLLASVRIAVGDLLCSYRQRSQRLLLLEAVTAERLAVGA